MMQGLHHQQQQLASLLAAALPKKDENTPSRPPPPPPPTATSAPPPSAADDDVSRAAALSSLNRAICYPPNSVLITHSAAFISQNLSQLLSDKSYTVRQAAATAYGALCSVLCSISIASNGRQNHGLLVNLVDQFISWALPALNNIGEGASELALEGLREFLNVGEVGAVERYALPIVKACQELLEDERTSLNLLHRLLSVLSLISVKFFRCFQAQFVDIVDLLLGWAMAPDLEESDRRVIMDSFLQFQKHWVNNLQFSLGLLSKFLGDMDVLLQDGSPGTPHQFERLLALLSCFCTVLQAVASGLLEINLLEQITEPLRNMIPILLGCLSLLGRKYRWSKWVDDSWRCLTLLAEILSYNFSPFYPVALEILFQSLDLESQGQLTSFQVHGVLKTNLHLLSLQKHGLLPSYVDKVLQIDAPLSQMRLHPNHLVTGSSAATYVFLLQHGNNEVVEKTMMFLIEELELLKNTLDKTSDVRNEVTDCLPLKCVSGVLAKCYSKDELIELIKFDLKVLLICVSLDKDSTLIAPTEVDSYINRSGQLVSLVSEKLNPFELPIQSHIELQLAVFTTLKRLMEVEFLCKCSRINKGRGDSYVDTETNKLSWEKTFSPAQETYFENLKKYAALLVSALQNSSPLAVKTVALHWICQSCENVINVDRNLGEYHFCRASSSYMDVISNLLLSVLYAAFDTEPKVRFLVPSALVMLLKAKVLHPSHFPFIAEVSLEKLGDPEKDIKSAFMKLVLIALPATVYVHGLQDLGVMTVSVPDAHGFSKSPQLHWKQLFALRALPRQLQSQQLVTVLSYLSQRWKVPLSSWILRLIQTCKRLKDPALMQLDDAKDVGPNGILWDINEGEDILEKICSVNLLSGAWWAVHEAARYCITTRLRTNLGGPTQTFAALERMLLDIPHVLHLDTEHNDGNVNITGSSYAHLLPMRLLLDFVEALKKNVYNAYEGSIVLPSTPRPSSMFFRANKKVCEEWFSRICEPMMNAGLALQCHHVTIHYCSLRLNDISNHVSLTLKDLPRTHGTEGFNSLNSRYAKDVMRLLQHMALALCKNNEHEALKGLQRWASRTFSALLQDGSRTTTDDGILGHFSWITGLVYQAKGQHEKAAAHFIHLLQTEESLSLMSSEDVQFVITRIIENFVSVSDWNSLDSWLSELQNLRAKHAGKTFSGALTTAGNEVNSIQALARFDEGDFSASWACLDLTHKSSSELTLDPKLALQRSEQMLLQAMLLKSDGKVDEASHQLHRGKFMLDEILSVLPLDGVVEAAPYINQLHCISAFEESSRLSGRPDQHFELLLGSYVQSLGSPINKTYQDCNMWLKVSRVFQTTLPLSPMSLKLCNNILILARKQRNLLLASRLTRYLRDHGPSCSDENVRDFIINSLQYEDILMMHTENKHEDALMKMWSIVRPCMVSPSSIDSDSSNNSMKAKACLKLSKWLRRDNLDVKMKNIVLKMQSEFEMTETSSSVEFPSYGGGTLKSKRSVDLIVEELVGSTLKLSTHLCPIMGKSWIIYGSWCYDQSKLCISSSPEAALSSCSFSSLLASEIYPERFSLTIEEKLEASNILSQFSHHSSSGEGLNEEVGVADNLSQTFEDKNHDEALLQQVISIIEGVSLGPGSEDSNGEPLSSRVRSELEKFLISQNIGLDEAALLPIVGDLVNIWWALRRRMTSLFGHAAQAFIKYLSCSSSKYYDGKKTCWDSESKHEPLNYTLRATLYILQILLNYGVELQETLEPALSAVPLLPWQEVTPQLFSRLSSHPEKVVRKQLGNLLVMLAKESPWSIVYPALVDATAYPQEPSEELQLVLAYLNKLHSNLVKDVQLMIKELTNVTVLWEELWLSTLQDLHGDVLRRINLLKDEAARVAENVTLSHGEKNKINAAKYSAMMAPVVVVLERRLASTSRKPETPHEKWFLEEFGKQISSAILNFKTPPTSAATIGDVWRPFDIIAVSLASHQRKSSVSLSEVAPQLAMLTSTDAPMPGHEKHVRLTESASGSVTAEGIVSISSIYEQVTILSTKTKPKKIIMLGSDGRTYTYLLKGREDLRLDARIMQMLQAVNGFLNSSSATRCQSLGIRYYSVTPIGGQAGLIQWVDNVTSIYTVFKSWQTRVQLAQLSTQGAGNAKSMVPPPVPRPVDMFYGKIIPALKEKGIRRVISRRDWPQDVKRKVLLDLMNEAPKELLRQELWCASEGFKAFSSKSKRYSGSVAAMSIVGHVLGLGDRHLDNILIDFRTGDILHIDYNVCFDKGKRLKVPEIVPFRLTQTLEAALGLTGIEGNFRAYCEAVLGVVKKNKDIILMLLGAFVWDPLVEWTRGDFHDDAAVVGEERKGMELAVSLSLFASRVQEIRVPLQEHHDLLLTTLPAAESALEKFQNILNQYEIVSTGFYLADQERSNLALHETSAKSIVSETTSKSEKILSSLEMQAREFAQVQAALMEKIQEASTWVEQHGRVLDALRNQSIPDMSAGFKLSSSGESLSLISAVLVAGVPTTIVPEPTQVQCHDIDREVSLTVAELDHGLSSAVAALETYALALQRILPLNYLTTSPIHGWAQILQLSVSSLSSEIISLARRQAVELVKKVQITESESAKRNYDNLCLSVVKYAAEIDRIEEENADLVKTIDPETEQRAKERLLSSFMKSMLSAGFIADEDIPHMGLLRHEGSSNSSFVNMTDDKKGIVLAVLGAAASLLYDNVKHKLVNGLNHTNRGRNVDHVLKSDVFSIFCELEEQVDKCMFVAGFVIELQDHIRGQSPDVDADSRSKSSSTRNWGSIFMACLFSCKNSIQKMLEVVLPEVLRSFISSNSDVMDVFRSVSQVKGSVDSALEQLIELELEKVSLVELEQNYFVKVGLITEKQLALEEAALRGRDHLSWEEAEELASQEEACRVQLDKLHHAWSQKDARTSSLMKKEASIRSSFVSLVHHLQSLINFEYEEQREGLNGRGLLALLVQPFTELELADEVISSYGRCSESSPSRITELADLIHAGCPISQFVWDFPLMGNNNAFFIWKLYVIYSFLDTCTHDAALSVDLNLGFDQLINVVKLKAESQLQEHIGHYLKGQVAPMLMSMLNNEIETLSQTSYFGVDVAVDDMQETVKRVHVLLEEFCHAHETVRTARSSASLKKRKVNELKEALLKTSLEIIQMEWMHDAQTARECSIIHCHDS
ncbi:hypothetical protein Leryth_004338 [Lithospermum erythrorhizon]|nr:hypothetical protein Leryth_004338 [Lithospermum erythrorhizon]